jgi:hypothetical protein
MPSGGALSSGEFGVVIGNDEFYLKIALIKPDAKGEAFPGIHSF